MKLPGDDPELRALWRRYVGGPLSRHPRRYLRLMGANFLFFPKPDRFLRHLRKDAARISDHELSVLLDGEWRSRTTAAWLIAVSRRDQFREQLAQMLLGPEGYNSGDGYCLALARFGTAHDAEILIEYLDRHRGDEFSYNQRWALGALIHLSTLLDLDLGLAPEARPAVEPEPITDLCDLLDAPRRTRGFRRP